MSRQDDLKKLITEHYRHLSILKNQEAGYGSLNVPTHLVTQIQDREAAIEQLQAELAELERNEGPPAQTKLTTAPGVSLPALPIDTLDSKLATLRAQAWIFLCHASQDKPRVKELYQQLKDAGYRPWLDKYDLLPGQDWEFEIRRVIRESDFFLACLSPNSTDKRGYVQKEIKIGLDILDQMPEGKIYLIPVRLEACAVPERLQSRHWVDLFEPGGFAYLTRALDYEIRSQHVTLEQEPVSQVKARSARLTKPKLVSTPPTPMTPVAAQSRPLNWPIIGCGATLLFLSIMCVIISYTIRGGFGEPTGAAAVDVNTDIPSSTIIPTDTVIPPTHTPTVTQTPTNIPLPTNTPGPSTNSLFPEIITASNDATMVLVPAGSFEMGKDRGFPNEQPAHEVILAAFYIDQYEVTNVLYRHCVEAGECEQPRCSNRYEAETKKNHPVVCISWEQAKKYCEWQRARLPTEAEWEKAARGTDGRVYPWGNKSPDATLLNFLDSVGDTTSVGSYPNGVSPYGVYDMAGNVYEWVADAYDENYYSYSPTENPLGPTGGGFKVLRGGSWANFVSDARATNRHHGVFDTVAGNIGFRCAATAP